MALPNSFNSNTSTPAPSTTIGFKISKPGYDARRTVGSNYVFDSSWPSLPIAFETTIVNPITSTGSKVTIAHNLQFPPFAMVWGYGNDNSGIANVGARYYPVVDGTNIYLDSSLAVTSGQQSNLYRSTNLKIRCFQLDLSKDIDYTLAPGDTFNMPYDPSFGVKITKPGKNINSNDMRDFALHSRCQSPLILAVKTEATKVYNQIQTGPSTYTQSNVVQYSSNLNNPSWVYGYVRLNASGTYPHAYVPAPMYTQSPPRTFTDGFTSYVIYDNYEGATLVILRDPMFAATQQTVQY